MNLDTQIYQQNPQWLERTYHKPEQSWFHRPYFKKALSWLDKKLIITFTGVRRSGKSTILRQIQYFLEEKNETENIFYFSFEKSQVKYHPEVLRDIIDWYLSFFLKKSVHMLDKKVYIFLDEIQYIPFWQDVLKSYYDQTPNIKFIISGSSSLFIKKKSLESLAGRIVEITVHPLHFSEYLTIKNLFINMDMTKIFKMQTQVLTGYFEDYLRFGQFPELVKDNYTPEQAGVYLSSIEEKIIEQDLPKLYKIERIDILKLIYEFTKAHSGQVMEYKNITNDLGIDLKTTIKYFDYLNKSYLIKFCLNKMKKAVKSARTAKKIYLVSTNLSSDDIGLKVENYVFNYLHEKGHVSFFRKGNFEVDFLLTSENILLPLEVKYQNNLEKHDYTNIIKLSQKLKLNRAFIVSKNVLAENNLEGIKIRTVPASLLEEVLTI